MSTKKSCGNCDHFTKGADESYCNFSWSDVKCENFNKWELKHLLEGDIYQPQLDNCKWLFDFNTEVATAILNYSKVISHLLQRIEILEGKLEEYEKIL